MTLIIFKSLIQMPYSSDDEARELFGQDFDEEEKKSQNEEDVSR